MNSFRLRLAGALGLAFIPMPWNMFHLVLPAARAEAPAVQSPRTFSRSPVVRLPLQIDDRTRASLAEIKLFVKGPGADWVLAQAAPASVTNFDFRADKDGEYAFMFVTVDKGGRTAPSNLNSRAPHQVILIDSTAPQLSVVPLPVANRDIYLQCRMTDANPDWTSVKLEYAIGENQWRLMDQANPESPGVFRIPHASVLEGKVRASACDKAGNVAVRIIDLGDPTKTYGTVERPLVPVEPKSIPMDIVKNDLAIPNIDNQATTKSPAIQTVDAKKVESIDLRIPDSPPVNTGYNPIRPKPIEKPLEKPLDPVMIPDVAPAIVEPKITENLNIMPPADVRVEKTSTSSKIDTTVKVDPYLPPIDRSPAAYKPEQPIVQPKPVVDSRPAMEQKPAPVVSTVTQGTHPIISTSQCTLEYAVENVIIGSQARIEFWGTRDNGRTWLRVPDESGGRSPAKLQLPGDGLYGIRVKANGNAQAPHEGEAPDCWIEVDTVAPTVRLLPPTLGTGPDAGTLTIQWLVHDKNLSNDSISIHHASRPEGPWLPIATGLRNDGTYRWLLPAGIGAEVYLRLEAVDRAGNIGRKELAEPVMMPQPKVRVIGIGPAR